MTASDSAWPASADLIAQLKTAIGQRDMERDPFVRQALVIRVSDLQYRLAELNSTETARIDALQARTTFDVDPQAVAEAFMIDDAWLTQLAEQAAIAAGIVGDDRHAARVACVLAVPALLAEIRRLRQEQERDVRLMRGALDELALLRASAESDPEAVTRG